MKQTTAIGISVAAAMLFLNCGQPEDGLWSEGRGALTAEPACTVAASGTGADCDGTTNHLADYKTPDPSVYVNATDAADAQSKCGKWAVRGGTEFSPGSGAKCKTCPSHSTGCAITNPTTPAGEVSDAGGGQWKCKGNGSGHLHVNYTCSRCVADVCIGPIDAEPK